MQNAICLQKFWEDDSSRMVLRYGILLVKKYDLNPTSQNNPPHPHPTHSHNLHLKNSRAFYNIH